MSPKDFATAVGCSPAHVRLMIRTKKIVASQIPSSNSQVGYVWDIPETEIRVAAKEAKTEKRGFPRGKRRRPNEKSRLGGLRMYPLKYYVYGWFSDASILPFYIGRGTDYRAIETHYTDNDLSPCEIFRRSCTGFRIEVFVHNIGLQNSVLLETTLIRVMRASGACQFNTNIKPEFRKFPGFFTN